MVIVVNAKTVVVEAASVIVEVEVELIVISVMDEIIDLTCGDFISVIEKPVILRPRCNE